MVGLKAELMGALMALQTEWKKALGLEDRLGSVKVHCLGTRKASHWGSLKEHQKELQRV